MGRKIRFFTNQRFVYFSVLMSFSLLIGAVGCKNTDDTSDSINTDMTAIQTTNDDEETTSSSEDAATDAKITAAPETTATVAASVAETTVVPTTASLSETTHPPVVNKAAMYSSYAFLSSFDPATGLAEFDYFDMLLGQDAIDWLVSHEGYTQAEAEDTVNNFVDGEFVMKNVNPQLRTVDLRVTPLKAIYYADGSQTATWPESEPISFADFAALYAYEKAGTDGIDYVSGSMFYYITVVNDKVTEVKQVFWV